MRAHRPALSYYDDNHLSDTDEDVQISEKLQRMADEMHKIASPQVDERAITAELARMEQAARPTPADLRSSHTFDRPRLRPTKTPKFAPEIHARDDDYEDVGNDSFELLVSPRKGSAPKPAAAKYKAVGPGVSQNQTVKAALAKFSATEEMPKEENVKPAAAAKKVGFLRVVIT